MRLRWAAAALAAPLARLRPELLPDPATDAGLDVWQGPAAEAFRNDLRGKIAVIDGAAVEVRHLQAELIRRAEEIERAEMLAALAAATAPAR
jgi:hypothetical protein